MDTLPLDILLYLFMFVGPRQLYNADLACVCKKWHAAVQALAPTLRRERWHAYSLGVHVILPRQVCPADDYPRLSLDDNGNVMCLCSRHIIRVDGGWKCCFDEPQACLHSMICDTFAMVGPLVYIRNCQTVVIVKNGVPKSPVSIEGAISLRTYGGSAWILGQDGLFMIQTTRVEKVLPKLPEDVCWTDFVIIGDIIYIATSEDVFMVKDGKRSILELNGVYLYEHNGELYAYADDYNIYIRATDGTVRIIRVDQPVYSLACVGTCMCVAVYNAIVVWPAKGEPMRINSPNVKKLVATNNKLYALSSTGVISIFAQ